MVSFARLGPLVVALSLVALAPAPAAANPQLAAFNADLERIYGDFRPRGLALLRAEIEKELNAFEHDKDKLEVRVRRIDEITINVDPAPGLTAAEADRIGLRIPRRGGWSLEVRARVEVRARYLWRWRTHDIPVRLIVEDLSAATTLRIDSSDPTRPTLTEVAPPDIRFKARLRSHRLFPGIVVRILNPFLRKAARAGITVAARALVQELTPLLQELSAPPPTAAPTGPSAGPPPPPRPAPPPGPAVDGAALADAMEARRRDYLAYSAQGGGFYGQVSRLELGQPIERAPLDDALDFIDSRQDTADFRTTRLLRLLYLHGNSPDLPADWLARAKQTLLGFRYWIDEPNPDDMIFSSENHQILFAASELLAGQLYPNEVFSNDGRTGAAHAAGARPRILRWLDHRLRFGFSEWYSPVYYPHDVAPLLNLIDFSGDPEIEARASMVLDLLLFDLARLTQEGSFGVTAGRAKGHHKQSGRGQGVGDLIEVLFGTRGEYRSRGATGATCLATSRRYRVPHVLLAVGVDREGRYVDRARMGIDLADGPREGIGFQSFEDGMFWWGMGGFVAPEVIALTRRMGDAWSLWGNDPFDNLKPLRNAPDTLLTYLSNQLSPASRGAVLSRANLYAFRSPGVQLSSIQAYRPGHTGFQQHAWQATFDLDASVWTTAPSADVTGGHGPDAWTGSSSMPLVVQHEDVAVILYNPPTLTRDLFPAETHAWFPRAAFDEVREAGNWTFARKGEGYLGLYSAQRPTWTRTGDWADAELKAPGYRNVWICQVGGADAHGSFDAFVAALEAAPVEAHGAGGGRQADPLGVRYQAPGVGHFDVSWTRPATLDGRPILDGDFPRFDNRYAQQAWGDPRLEVRHGGLLLRHDRLAGVRDGDGL